MAVTVCIAGAAGRMGSRLVALAREDPELSVRSALERPGHPWLGQDLGLCLGLGPMRVQLMESLGPGARAEVLVDFSAASASAANAEAAAEMGMALVVGATGLSAEEEARLRRCAAKVPLIHAPNFSVGVAVMVKAAGWVAKSLGPEYEVEIIEAHHNQKVDAPSGTALALGGAVAESLGRDLRRDAVYGRKGATGKRTRQEIGIHALRMGDVVGEHTVCFAAGGERIELTHRAFSRDTFARGALRAAKWLAQPRKPPGLYTVAQVLGLQ